MGPLAGFVVTWDVDSADQAVSARLRRFVYGYAVEAKGRDYRYPGFVEKDGVRSLGQSVLFVAPDRLGELRALSALRIEHEVDRASIG